MILRDIEQGWWKAFCRYYYVCHLEGRKKTLSSSPTLSFHGDRQVGTNQEINGQNISCNIELLTFQYSNCQIVSGYVWFVIGVIRRC
jgi:hypothetical protein